MNQSGKSIGSIGDIAPEELSKTLSGIISSIMESEVSKNQAILLLGGGALMLAAYLSKQLV